MIKKRILLIFVIVVLSCLIVIFSKQIFKLRRAGGIVEQKEEELAVLRGRKNSLKEQLKQVESPEYIEEVAREKLGMGKEGEKIVILPRVGSNELIPNQPEKKENWQKWWQLFFY